MKRISRILNKNVVLTIITLIVSAQSIMAQVTGPSPVAANTTHTYQFTDGFIHLNRVWTAIGGTIISEWYTKFPTTYKVSILWGTGSSGSITLTSNGFILGGKSVVITGGGSSSTNNLSNENYIHTLVPTIETTNVSVLAKDKTIESITYFDGLGRPKQSNSIRGGGDSKDIIIYNTYDAYGRQAKAYLPYPVTTDDGAYKTDALNKTNAHYKLNFADDFTGIAEQSINPYSESLFESSPLNRVQKTGAPGKDWDIGNGKEIEFNYATNTTGEVKRYEVSLSFALNTYTPTLVLNGSYSAGALYKSTTKDENHTGTDKDRTIEAFKDKTGKVLLKRTYNNEVAHDTYYVYDAYGNLTYVLPPKSEPQSALPDATELSELCYQYKYDHRNRLVEKKIPGKDWEYIVYNNLNQPILTQDANQRVPSTDKWLFTKYDIYGRVAYTGEMSRNISRTSLQSAVDGTAINHVTKNSTSITIDGTTIYYNNSAYPTSYITQILTINYYDNYTFDKVSGNSEIAYGITPITDVKGLPTGSKIRVLGTNDWITSVSYYDSKSRPIYIYTFNDYLNTTDKIKNDLGFSGEVQESTTTHDRTLFSPITTVDFFDYDHMMRLKQHKQTIGGGAEEVIVQNEYDELGQLVTKKVGNTVSTPLQTVDYTYNVRGWLKQINDPNASLGADLFAFKINYNTTSHSGTALYNGNISETEWKTSNDNVLRWYKYSYDDLNRINSGTNNSSNYNLTNVDYDKNGNIKNLTRRGQTNSGATTFGDMDVLVYTYENSEKSNQLQKVLDNGNDTYGFKDGINTTTEYTYDANGNMWQDKNKGINTNITYNHLNLPTLIDFGGGDKIEYFYDATGVKLKKKVTDGGATETFYAGNYVYEGSSLKFFNHPEGYVEPDGSNWDYIYQYKDHLGSIRLSYKNTGSTSSPTLQIQEENNYYPFGLKHKGYNGNIVSEDKFHTFQGQEEEKELGKNTYAFQWRDYDPAIGRFNKIDRFAEKYVDNSPYSFTMNNPMRFREIKGDSLWINYAGNRILYENGNLKNRDGSAYTGSGVTVASDGSTSLSGFLKEAVGALNSIRTGGDSGNELVSGLQNDASHVFLSEGSNKASGLRVSWNPSDTDGGVNQEGSTNRPAYVGLAHELGHAYDALDGAVDRTPWVTLSDGTVIPEAERYGAHWENRIRGENKLSLRTHYAIDGGTPVGSLLGTSGGSSSFYTQKQLIPSVQLKAQGSAIDGTFKIVPVPGTRTIVIPFKYN